MIEITIPLAPISKKNSQQILMNRKTQRPFIMPSKKYLEYEKSACAYIHKCMEDEGIERPIDYAVEVSCVFYMPTKRMCDLTNLLEALDDVLVKGGLICDDHYGIIASHDGSRVKYDKDYPRTEVTILPL